jgi:hypothetical protein
VGKSQLEKIRIAQRRRDRREEDRSIESLHNPASHTVLSMRFLFESPTLKLGKSKGYTSLIPSKFSTPQRLCAEHFFQSPDMKVEVRNSVSFSLQPSGF